MVSPPDPRPRLLLVGGGGGLLGRNLLAAAGERWTVRSVHPHRAPGEARPGIEWIPADVARVADWGPLLRDVDLVVNVAWRRAGPDRHFRPLAAGLLSLVRAAERAGVSKFVQVSVPPATPSIEAHLPYMVRKREVDASVAASDLDYTILRPTMLFGSPDRLLTVMLRTIHRYGRLPMFGEGSYHVSPIAAVDFADVVLREGPRGGRRTLVVGGPTRYEYRELTDLLFRALGRSPRYLRFSPRGGVRLAWLLEHLGSRLLYAYEVEWLTADLLGLPAYAGLERPLLSVESFVRNEAARLRAG